jgi:hypothetical protein
MCEGEIRLSRRNQNAIRRCNRLWSEPWHTMYGRGWNGGRLYVYVRVCTCKGKGERGRLYSKVKFLPIWCLGARESWQISEWHAHTWALIARRRHSRPIKKPHKDRLLFSLPSLCFTSILPYSQPLYPIHTFIQRYKPLHYIIDKEFQFHIQLLASTEREREIENRMIFSQPFIFVPFDSLPTQPFE